MLEIQNRWTRNPTSGTVTLAEKDLKRLLVEIHDQWQWGEALERSANWGD